MRSNESYADPSWVNYYNMCACVFVFATCASENDSLCGFIFLFLFFFLQVHALLTRGVGRGGRVMYSANGRTPADGWLGANPQRREQTSAGSWILLLTSVLTTQLGVSDVTTRGGRGGGEGREGGLFCLESVSMRHNASPPSTPLRSQRAGNNHWIKARPKLGESQIK